ncbi:ribosome biogenesis factor YjgA [Microbulbifer echini]|uniref:Dual-action ribosomal maturation protein DarP n=1 Tax=Microbulbifer echini TaxID=1529067 RepID=A0ABV4NP78_9GAMM|nr:ribosome biogenesis factor YjgA [uncultured Microbulbifer sp.]
MYEYDDHDEDLPKSKTQLKQEMHELQALGKQLTELSKAQLAEVPIDEDMREAIETFARIKSNEARRRQMQYIGKLMRSADHEAVEAVLNKFKERDHQHLRFDKMAEEWRKRLLEEGNTAQGAFFDQHPQIDHQHLRQLVRDSLREIKNSKPPSNQRKLFRYLRDFFIQISE